MRRRRSLASATLRPSAATRGRLQGTLVFPPRRAELTGGRRPVMDDGLHARIESIRIRGFRSLADVTVTDLPLQGMRIGSLLSSARRARSWRWKHEESNLRSDRG